MGNQGPSSLLAVFLLILSSILISGAWGWGGGGDKVLLKEVQVLTLVNGQYTNGRRSAGVPQLKCLGGTAHCKYLPQTVQCYNRGWDGYDVQWECKADMENAYKFGKVEVTCEGFDYPDDPYILRGSCGLEYTIDLTKEGQSQHGGSYNSYYQDARNWYQGKRKGDSTMSTIACGVGLCIIVYAIYKTCIQPSYRTQDQYSRRNDDYPDSGSGRPGTRPPPPGFNPSFYPNSGDSAGESCSAGASASQARQGSSAGGFWTGAATGGLLGYMFGSRNNTGYAQTGYGPRPSTSYGFGGGSSWSGAGPSTSSGFSSGSSSSGSRTASGFGGTRRR